MSGMAFWEPPASSQSLHVFAGTVNVLGGIRMQPAVCMACDEYHQVLGYVR